jgi:DNA-binding beta-propeller fold protein YncE
MDENVIREPIGVALDKNRNVYVAGNGTNNVVVLSPDGKNCRQILTKSDGLDEPSSLRINIDRSELLVCNKNGPAFLLSLLFSLYTSSISVLIIHKYYN